MNLHLGWKLRKVAKTLSSPVVRYFRIANARRIYGSRSTKFCHSCGNVMLLRMPSKNTKRCTDCDTVMVWKLEEGQERLV